MTDARAEPGPASLPIREARDEPGAASLASLPSSKEVWLFTMVAASGYAYLALLGPRFREWFAALNVRVERPLEVALAFSDTLRTWPAVAVFCAFVLAVDLGAVRGVLRRSVLLLLCLAVATWLAWLSGSVFWHLGEAG